MYVKHEVLDGNDLLYSTIECKSDTEEKNFDVDLMAAILDKRGLLVNERDLIFYNNHSSRTGALFHISDNQSVDKKNITKETILINLSKLPTYCKYIRFIAVKSAGVKNICTIDFSIGKRKLVFDIDGQELYHKSMSYCDYEVCYLFEIVKNSGVFTFNLAMKNCNMNFNQLLCKYNILNG